MNACAFSAGLDLFRTVRPEKYLKSATVGLIVATGPRGRMSANSMVLWLGPFHNSGEGVLVRFFSSGSFLRSRPLMAVLILFGAVNLAVAGEAKDQLPASTPRIKYTINENWRFLPEDLPDAEQPDCDDSAWKTVELPHTWNTEDPFDDQPGYRRGPSWYRRTLHLGPQLAGKRLFLHFEGAHQFAQVFVNGRPAGQHKGGYTAFTFEITDLVEFNDAGAAAVLAVRVDNSHDTSIPPLAIGYAFYGGIYRDVWLIATDPLHFDLLDHGSPGIYVDTPDVSAQSGTVRVRGAVLNQSGEVRDLRVVTMVLDADNRPVTRVETPLAVAAGGRAEFEQLSDPVNSPHLWSPDDPHLYRVCCAIEDSNGLRDAYKSGLGFRWFEFDAQKGFSLNGRRLFLRGASRHQDYQGLGSALPNWMHRSDLEWLKRMGGNFIRLAHYPQEQEVLDAADRLGLIVWEEIPIVTTMSTTPAFAETARTNLTEMIRQHYNHPSVMMWGYMNEVLLGWKPRRPRADQHFPEKVVPLARELEELARGEDPTRTTVMAMHTSIYYDRAGISKVPMVAGWNIYFGWYGNVLGEFGNFLDRQHEAFPDRPIIVSEYGAGSDARLHSLNPHRFDHTTEYMFAYHESYWQQIKARPWLAGSLIWNQFDFSQPGVGDSMPHVNQKGMLTWDRKPKDVYYFYQANWVGDPVIHIASREWSRRTGTCRDAALGAGPQP